MRSFISQLLLGCIALLLTLATSLSCHQSQFVSSTDVALSDSPNTPTRDPWLWPFAQNSIWNTPLGSEADYVPVGIQDADWIGVDVDLLFKVPPGSPERPIYDPGSWTRRCSGKNVADPTRRKTIPIPDNLIVPDAKPPETPNNASAFLLPDGRTLVQINPLARCDKGGPVYGWVTENVDIYGPGIRGGHGGSGLSSIGGTIRRGELTGKAAIGHVLKVNLWAKRYLSYNQDGTPGYRWPAESADGYAKDVYGGKNPELEMGSLLAIPPSITEEKLGLRTNVGRKLFHAFQDYGAYVVDDTAGDAHVLAIESGVEEEVLATAQELNQNTGVLHDEINKLFRSLDVIANNGPNRIGGGGTRRAPLAPPFDKKELGLGAQK